MFFFPKFKFSIYMLIFSSCVNFTNKTSVSSNDKFYKIENIDENDIITDIVEIDDTNKMIFVKGGKFNFGSDTRIF